MTRTIIAAIILILCGAGCVSQKPVKNTMILTTMLELNTSDDTIHIKVCQKNVTIPPWQSYYM
jgi:hypothetical protein